MSNLTKENLLYSNVWHGMQPGAGHDFWGVVPM